jgi:hypothetical protein
LRVAHGSSSIPRPTHEEGTMHRPTRQRATLLEKVAAKQARSHKKKTGKRTKRWKKWIEQYKPAE